MRPEPVDLVKWRRALRHPNGPPLPIVRHVLLTLATWGDKDGGNMFPGSETLACATGYVRNTVQKALQIAVQTGWVRRGERRRGPYGKPRYFYEATVPGGWALENDVDHPWETDPQWTSERVNRKRTRADVPHAVGDKKAPSRKRAASEMPACPPSDDVLSPISRADVPHMTHGCPPPGEHDLFMTSSKTSSDEGPALTRQTATDPEGVKDAHEGNPETGAPTNPAAARRNGSDVRQVASEVFQGRTKPERRKRPQLTAEAGAKFVVELHRQDGNLEAAIEHARRAGYPIDLEAIRAQIGGQAA